MREEITKAFMKGQKFMLYRLSNSLSSSHTHVLFPLRSVTTACGSAKCQHLISSLSPSLFSLFTGQSELHR